MDCEEAVSRKTRGLIEMLRSQCRTVWNSRVVFTCSGGNKLQLFELPWLPMKGHNLVIASHSSLLGHEGVVETSDVTDHIDKNIDVIFLPGLTIVHKMIKDLTSLIIRHTVVSRRHLTPELAVRVIDHTCPLWTASEEQSPFKDPFWAFYWPGGQATARYILDNGNIVKNRRVLDVGCGCGAGSIAAVKMKAKMVVANDIDPCATTATDINAKLNDVTLETCTNNYIGTNCADFDAVLIGDMFYDAEFAVMLFDWLRILTENGKTVILGDPGRHGLTLKMREHVTLLAKYELPRESCEENHGFTDATVWTIH